MTFSHAYTQPRRNRDVGVATAFLASDYAKMITGDVMRIGGGYHSLA